MSDETTPDPVADRAAVLCNWLTILTGLMILSAIFVVLMILKDQYQRGLLA